MLASMRPAQLTPENKCPYSGTIAATAASMRPAQLTPENTSGWKSSFPPPVSFNEAGAINAGKREEHMLETRNTKRLQ